MSLLQPAYFLIPPAIFFATRGEVIGGVCWPIISMNYNLCLIYLFYRETERCIFCTCSRCSCNIQWPLSGRDLTSNTLWGCIGGHDIQVLSRVLFKQAKKIVFVCFCASKLLRHDDRDCFWQRMGRNKYNVVCHFCNIPLCKVNSNHYPPSKLLLEIPL